MNNLSTLLVRASEAARPIRSARDVEFVVRGASSRETFSFFFLVKPVPFLFQMDASRCEY